MALLLSVILSQVLGCGQPRSEVTIRAYAGTPEAVLVRLEDGSTVRTWVLPGRDDVRLLYSGRAIGEEARLVFLDRDTCLVLGVARNLPAHARVGLHFIDPAYSTTVSPDDGGLGDHVSPATGTGECQPR